MGEVDKLKNARASVKSAEKELSDFIAQVDERFTEIHQHINEEQAALERTVKQVIADNGKSILTDEALSAEIYSVMWNDGKPNNGLIRALFATLPAGFYYALPNSISWSFQGSTYIPTPCFMMEIPERADKATLDATWSTLQEIFATQLAINPGATLLISSMANHSSTGDFNVFALRKATSHGGYLLSSEPANPGEDITALVDVVKDSRQNFSLSFFTLDAALNFAVQNIQMLDNNRHSKRDTSTYSSHGFVLGMPSAK